MTSHFCLQSSRPCYVKTSHCSPLLNTTSSGVLPAARQLCSFRIRHRHCEVRRSSIGFDLGGANGRGTEKHADNLTKAASSLLLYQNVLSGKPAKAFLKLLLLLQRGRLQDILETYGDFYSSLAVASHLSWQDFLLEQILLGKQNAFAKAAARGELPRSSPRHKAAAYDLDILQKLAVAESTLVSWIEDVSSSIPDGWKEAALSSGPSTTPQRDAVKTEELNLPGDLSAPDFIQAPVSPAQRSAYRAWIGGKWRWSEALPELQYFYETHGFGVTSTDSGLKWVDGLLEMCDYDRTHMSLGIKGASASIHSPENEGVPHEVLQHIENFAKGSEDQKGLVYMGHQTVNLGSLVKKVGQHGIRVLHLTSTDLTKLANVASALYLYPRVKFAVVCNAWVEQKQATTWTALQEVFAGGLWPQNARLYLIGNDELGH